MKILEQGSGRDRKISSLGIVDPSRPYGTTDICDNLNWLNEWGQLFEYTIIDFEDDYYKIPETVPWCDWTHVGNHVEEGKYLWNFMHYKENVESFSLHDSPDFSGKFTDGHLFRGDIGKVSMVALLFSIADMREGDLWITVNGSEHTVLEAQYDIFSLLPQHGAA